MRKTLMTAALVLALCCPVFAGEMHTPVAPAPPPPQPAPATQGPTTDGIIHTPLVADSIVQNDEAATFLQVVLNLLALS